MLHITGDAPSILMDASGMWLPLVTGAILPCNPRSILAPLEERLTAKIAENEET